VVSNGNIYKNRVGHVLGAQRFRVKLPSWSEAGCLFLLPSAPCAWPTSWLDMPHFCPSTSKCTSTKAATWPTSTEVTDSCVVPGWLQDVLTKLRPCCDHLWCDGVRFGGQDHVRAQPEAIYFNGAVGRNLPRICFVLFAVDLGQVPEPAYCRLSFGWKSVRANCFRWVTWLWKLWAFVGVSTMIQTRVGIDAVVRWIFSQFVSAIKHISPLVRRVAQKSNRYNFLRWYT